MTVIETLRRTRHQERVLRLRRHLALRVLADDGVQQRTIAKALDTSQSAISQQLGTARRMETERDDVSLATLLDAAAPLLVGKAAELGFTDLAVFGSVARGDAGPDSDIDLIATAAPGTTLPKMSAFQQFAEHLLGTSVDFVTYGGLKPGIHDSIRDEAVPLS